jgi:hypothetical protein
MKTNILNCLIVGLAIFGAIQLMILINTVVPVVLNG